VDHQQSLSRCCDEGDPVVVGDPQQSTSAGRQEHLSPRVDHLRALGVAAQEQGGVQHGQLEAITGGPAQGVEQNLVTHSPGVADRCDTDHQAGVTRDGGQRWEGQRLVGGWRRGVGWDQRRDGG
jgi:hypothetical protein